MYCASGKYVGRTFGNLKILDLYIDIRKTRNKRHMVKCVCLLCNSIKFFKLIYVKANKNFILDCGCTKPPQHSKHPLYRIWTGINGRCYNVKHLQFYCYGGRGIQNYWKNDPLGFIEYIDANLGPRPSLKHGLDRIDNDKGYEPCNLRWATAKEQCNNKTYTNQRKVENLKIVLKQLKKENIKFKTKFKQLSGVKWQMKSG